MCGIYARIAERRDGCGMITDGAKHDRVLSRLAHRGPDAAESAALCLPWCDVFLAMTRLKIVDQSDISVPYQFPRLGVTLAFNGEIYNWRELRSELPGPWETECDAEVIAAAWREWGWWCLERFNGMFAFVLVDDAKNEIVVARDRAGEKPLYFAWREGALHLASEIKAFPFPLEPKLSRDAMTLEFDATGETSFAGVYHFGPGEYTVIRDAEDLAGAPARHTWWSLPSDPTPLDTRRTIESYVDELEELLIDATRIRRISERPIALQLSGGLDSAIVQAVAGCEDLYCVTFPEVDNLTQAELAASGDPVKPVEFTYEEMIEALPEIAYYLDTPATWTACCQWFMNKRAAEDGNVVILSGEGADELFGGYARYRILYWLDKMRNDDRLAAYVPLIDRTLGGSDRNVMGRMLNRGGPRTITHAEYLVGRYAKREWHLTEQMTHVDFYTTMQVLLRMADRMAAAFSMENRSPFFDYRVMEFAARLPVQFKINPWESKIILRRVAERLGVDRQIVHERTKRGLYIPQSWGAGERWDRAWFARLMEDAWRSALERMNGR